MKITLNLGCGNRTYTEYPSGHRCINVDERRNLTALDVATNLNQGLPFKDECCDYILASDIIEHFPYAKTKAIIREWVRVLKKGGVIEFRLPNLAYICQQYINGRDAKVVSWLLYGGQDYPGNFHYVGFDRKWFSSVCEKCGLKEVEYREAGSNFEMKGRKV